MFPDLREEKKLRRKGYKIIVGTDEAGRGALAGPVVAAAFCFKENSKVKNKKHPSFLREIKDSKKLSSKRREKLYKNLIKSPYIEWGIGRVFQQVIDKINILEATKLAMKRAIKNLEKKFKRKVNYLILDGNFKIDLNIPQKSIKGADEKVLSCACASVLAKVTRDRIMRRLDKKYSNKYKFSKHKGYGTKLHLKMLKRFGPCKIHRKSFSPVRKVQKFKR